MSPASRLLRYSTTVPSTRPRYYSTASLPHHHYVHIYCTHTASLPHHHHVYIYCTHTASLALQGAVEIDQRYSTTPLLYYFTTPLLYYFTTPLLYCFTTSPPLYKYIPCSHCVTRSPGCSRDRPVLLYYFTTLLLHYLTTTSLQHIHVLNSHCVTLRHSLSRVQ